MMIKFTPHYHWDTYRRVRKTVGGAGKGIKFTTHRSNQNLSSSHSQTQSPSLFYSIPNTCLSGSSQLCQVFPRCHCRLSRSVPMSYHNPINITKPKFHEFLPIHLQNLNQHRKGVQLHNDYNASNKQRKQKKENTAGWAKEGQENNEGKYQMIKKIDKTWCATPVNIFSQSKDLFLKQRNSI